MKKKDRNLFAEYLLLLYTKRIGLKFRDTVKLKNVVALKIVYSHSSTRKRIFEGAEY